MLSRAFDHICMEKARYKFLIIIIYKFLIIIIIIIILELHFVAGTRNYCGLVINLRYLFF